MLCRCIGLAVAQVRIVDSFPCDVEVDTLIDRQLVHHARRRRIPELIDPAIAETRLREDSGDPFFHGCLIQEEVTALTSAAQYNVHSMNGGPLFPICHRTHQDPTYLLI